MQSKTWASLVIGISCLVAIAGCGPSSEEIERLADERIKAALTAVPTPTPIEFPTPLPTPTPVTFPPTPTPVTFPPTPTPVTFPPTPTPVTFPPTPTPVTFPPTPTPQPTPTPITFPPTPTPITLPPTATPQPTPTPQPIVDFNAVYQQNRRSVFYIETSTGHGSGWLIEPDLILTNQHVVGGFSSVTVRRNEGTPFTAVVQAVDSLRDIALLRFDPAKVRLHAEATPFQLGQISTEDIAQALMALGYSGLSVNTDGTVEPAAANVGVLSQTIHARSVRFGLNLMMDAPVDPGDSGGPVLNADGLVVGMVWGVLERTGGGQRVVGTFFAVHVDEIRAALPALMAGNSR